MFSTLLYQVLDGILTFQSIDQLINHGYIFFVQYTANINITTHISGPKKNINQELQSSLFHPAFT